METNSNIIAPLKSEVIKTEFRDEDPNFDIEEIKLELTDHFKVSDEESDNKYNIGDSSGFDTSAPLRNVKVLQVFICEICKKSFKTKQELIIHLRMHTNERPYKCSVCVKAFKQSSALKEHIIAHTDIKKHKCEVCNVVFATSSTLKRHVKKIHESSKTYKCILCSEVFMCITLLKEHRKNHMKVTGSTTEYTDEPENVNIEEIKLELPNHLKVSDECSERSEPVKVPTLTKVKVIKINVCEICKKTFKTNKELTLHLRVHTNERPYECTYCEKAFKQLNALKDHIITHTGARKHKCEVCNFAFTTSSALKRHGKRIHESSKTYNCVLCSEVFISISLLMEHRENHMKVTGSTEIKNKENGKRMFRCGVCNKLFSRKELIFKHFKVHLDKTVKCEYCNLYFTTGAALKSHIKINHNHLVCSICNAEYRTKRFFNIHERDHFRDIKKNACDYCKQVFENLQEMTLHMQIEHITTKIPFQCTICSKCFISEKHLQFHQWFSHITCKKCSEYFDNEQQLKIHKILKHSKSLRRCKKCPAVFRTKSRLVFHMHLAHLIARRFKCKLCKKSFSRFKYLYSHMKMHSKLGNFCKTIKKDDGSMLYQCILCKRKYFSKWYIQGHLFIEHSNLIVADKRYECDKCSKVYYFRFHLQKHMIIHNSVRSFKCNLCDASYRLQSTLMAHITNTHEALKEIPCMICGLTVIGNFNLKKHITNIHKQHFCNNPLCVFKYFNSKRQLIEHETITHSNNRNKGLNKTVRGKYNNKNEAIHICNVCGLICTRPYALNKHKYLKHQETLSPDSIAKFEVFKVKCNLCNKVCLDKGRLNIHLKTHKGDIIEEELLCKICNKVFKKRSGLVWHEMKLHKVISKKDTNKLKDQLCNFCDKSFKSYGGLRNHVRNKHTNPVLVKEEMIKQEVISDIECDR